MPKLRFEPKWFIVLVFFLTGIFIGGLGIFAWLFNDGSVFGLTKIHPKNSMYEYINPLLAVDTVEKKQFLQNTILEDKLNKIFEDHKKKGEIFESSAYFRDLESGRWSGINEDLKFSPGKLLKIPLMMAYLQNAEGDMAQLEKKIVYKTKKSQEDLTSGLENGKQYSVEDLIIAMLESDDDDAGNVLYDSVNHTFLDEVYSDLGIDYKELKNTDDFITTKGYAMFFRVLYNATYLNREMSEKAVSILDNASSNLGTAAGLPSDFKVAQKYRKRTMIYKGDNAVESHDCGIIYYPDHPYILCVMSIGKDSETINDIFRQVGLVVYRDMNRVYEPFTK